MRRWLILRLEAPLLSFGSVAIDNLGPTADFPANSMLTGLLANALGWRRTDWQKHDALQSRLIVASRRDSEPYVGVFTDTQNALLAKNDRGWTTRGKPEGRDGASYSGAHRRRRDYHPDAIVLVALTLVEPETSPTLNDLSRALDHPARPIFFGRKSCLPSAPICFDSIEATDAHEALSLLPALDPKSNGALRAQWPVNEGPVGDRTLRISGRRNWRSGLHGGEEVVIEGRIVPAAPS